LHGAEPWILQKVDQKYLEALLEKDGEDQLDQSCEKRRSIILRSIILSQGAEEYPAHNKKEKG
jgi:hypothetical protein